jgi:hypothetical protein
VKTKLSYENDFLRYLFPNKKLKFFFISFLSSSTIHEKNFKPIEISNGKEKLWWVVL